jgi:hypothetical protein
MLRFARRLGLTFVGPAALAVAGCGKAAPPADVPYQPDECVVCHFDRESAWGRTAHFRAVGCIACHGPSDDHMAVEDNSIHPERCLPGEPSAACCLRCHGEDECAFHPTAGEPRGECVDCHPPH